MAQLGIDETMRILLVGEDQTIYTELSAALGNAVDNYKIDWVAQPELSTVRAKDILPHLILIDDALGDSDIASLIRQLNNEIPNATILALTPSGDVEKAKQAVLAGARGFLNKPLASDDLVATLSQLFLQPRLSDQTTVRNTSASGRVIAWCSAKGGSGCSTLMVNNAVALRRLTRQSVTAMDAHFNAPALHMLLNLLDMNNSSDLIEHLPRIEPDLLDQVLSPHASGIRVLQASLPSLTSHPINATQMQQILVALKRNADWVFVDLGIANDATAFAVLDAADRIVVSLLPEITSLNSTQLLLDRLRDRGYSEGKIWLTLNRATVRPAVAKSEIERRLRLRIQHNVADDQPLVSHSVNRGIPFVISHEKSALASSILSLARHLLEESRTTHRSVAQPETPRSNPFQRWMRGGTQAVSV